MSKEIRSVPSIGFGLAALLVSNAYSRCAMVFDKVSLERHSSFCAPNPQRGRMVMALGSGDER